MRRFFGKKRTSSLPKQNASTGSSASEKDYKLLSGSMGSLKIPETVPPPDQDCQRLKKAFDGFGTDEDAVIWILGHRNASQRREIKNTYQQLYNKSLIDDLQSELSGDFRDAVILWTCDPPERDAKLARVVLTKKKKVVKHLKVLVEIACASSPSHLMAVRQVYSSLFDCSLEEDIASTISLPTRKLLVGLVTSYRYDKQLVDTGIADSEASRLHEAIETKQYDHDHVVWILSTRNFFQLRATFECYKEKYGHSIDQDIKSCGNGELESLLIAVYWCIASPAKYFAEVIKDSIVGLGTDEDSLNRAIVTRAEIDMIKIREEYSKMSKTSLVDDIIGDTSGDYKNFLLTLIGERL
ncbi:annexin D3 [Pyrus x bretschneideri]|uniref:annexin D3 n=1 Tax=Pyrus x bretschneideri TaxID=225117 RepID=UPI00202E2A09|nr:annexin D3 [Pyrus x bretschneideri]